MTVIENVSSYRFLQIALFDVSATILGAYLVWLGLNRLTTIKFSFFFVTICMFLLGIVAHRIFGIRTTVDKFLFPVQ